MTDLFWKVLNMSISASYLVAAIIVLRLVLKKAPRWIHVLLWGIVALRLALPFSIESALSLIPSAEPIPESVLSDPVYRPVVPGTNDFSGLPGAGQGDLPSTDILPTPQTPIVTETSVDFWQMAAILWLCGIALMAIYTMVSYLRLRRRVGTAVREDRGIYRSEHVSSPFVLGLLKPRIYLPYALSSADAVHVIAHEQAHIRRKDHWWKPLGFALLAVHWFNPLMWLAYILLCRDIELACDEKVIQTLALPQRADYSQALLQCSVSRRSIAACPLAFGEVGVKERVKNVLNYKKPAFWIILVAILACVAVAVCFLTDPPGKKPDPGTALAPGTAQEHYDLFTHFMEAGDMQPEGEFQLEGFPGVTFHWNHQMVEAVTASETAAGRKVLFGPIAIYGLYSADLSGDGKPEICASVNDGAGAYILVYDYATGTSYPYGQDRSIYSYYLSIENEYLVCRECPGNSTSITEASGRLVLTATQDGLALALEGTDTPVPIPAVSIWYEGDDPLYNQADHWHLEQFPDVTFILSNNIFQVLSDGKHIASMQFTTLHRIYTGDLNGDGYPEVCVNYTMRNFASSISWANYSYSCLWVYDPVAQTSSSIGQISDNNIYTLRIVGGRLFCDRTDYHGNTVTGIPTYIDTVDGKQLYLAPLPGTVLSSEDAPVITWYERDNPDYPNKGQWQLEAFPGVIFRTSGANVEAEVDGKTTKLIDNFTGHDSVYATDLNGDGKPEICASGNVGSGMIVKYVVVYDYAAGKSYALIDPHKYSYSLRVEDGKLLCDMQRYGIGTVVLYSGRLSFYRTTEGNDQLFLAPLDQSRSRFI